MRSPVFVSQTQATGPRTEGKQICRLQHKLRPRNIQSLLADALWCAFPVVGTFPLVNPLVSVNVLHPSRSLAPHQLPRGIVTSATSADWQDMSMPASRNHRLALVANGRHGETAFGRVMVWDHYRPG
jgi:hypothetical protein